MPSAFTAGNIIVERVGDGTANLTSAATAAFLDEYTPSGTLVQTVAMPIAASGANHPSTVSGTATSEGFVTRSADGQYLIAVGYDAIPGTAGVVGSTTIPRVIARIAFDGTIDTSTTTTSFSGGNIRSATSTNGSEFWAVGANTGVVYTPYGGSGAGTIVSNSVTNIRVAGVFDSQLYVSSGSGSFRGVNTVGAGTPTTSGQTTTRLTGLADGTNPSDYGYFIADLSTSVPGVDTLYIADDNDVVGLMKWSLVGGTWTNTGAITATGAVYRSVTGTVSGSSVTLYATRKNGELVTLADNSGYNGTISGTPTILASSADPTKAAFRSVTMAPEHINLPPVNTLPSSFDVAEDTDKFLTGISIADPDVLAANIKVTISVPSGKGTLTVKTDVTGGVETGDVTGNGSNSVEIVATLAKINTTLAHANGLKFSPAANWNSPADGNVTLTMVSDDLGNTGVGGTKSDTDTSTLTITEVNDAPTAIDDSLSSIAEDSGDRTISFAALLGNDSKGPANESGQVLTIAAVGNAVGGTVEISGTSVIFHPTADFNGSASFDYTVEDDGTTNGSADFKTDIGTVTFTITEVNDAPIAGDDPLSSIAEDSGDRTIALADLANNDSKGVPTRAARPSRSPTCRIPWAARSKLSAQM